MASAVAAEVSAVLANTSTRTLLLGIDKTGRIRQHDRGAGDVLSGEPGALIGTELGTLLARGPQHHAGRGIDQRRRTGALDLQNAAK